MVIKGNLNKANLEINYDPLWYQQMYQWSELLKLCINFQWREERAIVSLDLLNKLKEHTERLIDSFNQIMKRGK